MPNSLRCKIKHLCHNGTLTERERDRILKALEQEPKWIPVSERLPEEETDVLVCNANGDIEISSGSYSTEVKNEYIWYTSGWRFGKVIAWMPLPKPYKAKSEEDNAESEVEECH